MDESVRHRPSDHVGEHCRKEGGECCYMVVGERCLKMGVPGGGRVQAREGREPKDIGSCPVGEPRLGGDAWGRGGVCQVLETCKEGGGRDATGEGEENYGEEYKGRRRDGHGASPWLPTVRGHTWRAKTTQWRN